MICWSVFLVHNDARTANWSVFKLTTTFTHLLKYSCTGWFLKLVLYKIVFSIEITIEKSTENRKRMLWPEFVFISFFIYLLSTFESSRRSLCTDLYSSALSNACGLWWKDYFDNFSWNVIIGLSSNTSEGEREVHTLRLSDGARLQIVVKTNKHLFSHKNRAIYEHLCESYHFFVAQIHCRALRPVLVQLWKACFLEHPNYFNRENMKQTSCQ